MLEIYKCVILKLQFNASHGWGVKKNVLQNNPMDLFIGHVLKT
jgi:hypothetical protein